MSTRIYFGYRVKVDRINEVLDTVKDKVWKIAIDNIMDWFPEEPMNYIEFLNHVYKIRELFKRHEVYDFDCGLNIWIKDGYCYIIFVKGSYLYTNKIPDLMPDFVEDFSYFDNTDKPEGISEEEWEYRGTVWEGINCGTGKSSYDARKLYFQIVETQEEWNYRFVDALHKRMKEIGRVY